MRRCWALVMSVVLTAMVVGVDGSVASAGPTIWKVVPSPNVGTADNGLKGISCVSTSYCVAAGSWFDGSVGGTVVESWDGVAWSIAESPSPGTFSSLQGVTCVARDDCTAVGDYLPASGPVATLVEHWDGSTWSIVPSPSGDGFSALTGVACLHSTSCVAVGYSSGGDVPLLEVWDGSTWSIADNPDPGPGTLLRSVACVASIRCFVVGSASPRGGRFVTRIESWDGSTWTVERTPSDGARGHVFHGYVDNELYGVACATASDCWAVGAFNSRSPGITLVERWDGKRWSIVPSPNGSTGNSILRAVSCVNATDCAAVGDSGTSTGFSSLVETWDGTAWTIETSASPGAAATTLTGVACAPRCRAVGSAYDSGASAKTLALARRPRRPTAPARSGPRFD